MEFQVELSQTLDKTPACLDGLSELIDLSWIEQALQATSKASIRRRRLPAEHVVWLVIGVALFRKQPIWPVVRQLDLVLDTPKSVCAPSAAVQGCHVSDWETSRWHTCSSNSPRHGEHCATAKPRD